MPARRSSEERMRSLSDTDSCASTALFLFCMTSLKDWISDVITAFLESCVMPARRSSEKELRSLIDTDSGMSCAVSESCAMPAKRSSEEEMRSLSDTDSGASCQVFLCHRGTDTKRTFVDVLNKELKSKGITSFVDYEMEDGTAIVPCIQEALEGSRVFIIVLSPGFASSKWCLNEVAEIMKIYRSDDSSHAHSKVLLLPVFYDVGPFEVRHQTSRYDLSKVKRSTPDDREQWSNDLKELSKIKGIEYDTKSMFLEAAVERIVERVETFIGKATLRIEESKWRAQIDVLGQLLASNALFIGVHGPNGVEFSDDVVKLISPIFHASSILSDEDDLIEKLYSDLLSTRYEPAHKLKYSAYTLDRLRNKRCLIVLHDVARDIKQLRPLLDVVKERLRMNSLMIFTSPFRHRLREVEVDEVISLPWEDKGGLLLICHGDDIHEAFINHIKETFCMRGLDVRQLSKNEVVIGSEYLEKARVILTIISNSLSVSDVQELITSRNKIVYVLYGRQSTNENTTNIRFDFEVSFEGAAGRFDKTDFKVMVEKVMRILNQADGKILDGPTFPTGIERRCSEIESDIMLRVGKSVQGFGLVGMGGIGKTTIAMSIFNRMHKMFESSFFCSKVRDYAGPNNIGLVGLQKKILHNTIMNRNETRQTNDKSHSSRMRLKKINHVEDGKTLLKSELRGINALIVLDDVDHDSHIEALYEPLRTLGAKSVVIITTRNLDCILSAQLTYFNISGLCGTDSERLFHWHAFLKPEAPTQLKKVSQDVIAACKGLPLSLKVIGSYLYDKSDISSWEESLRHLQENEDIFSVLRISYDRLTEMQKEAYLDMCCFLIGEEEDNVYVFLKSCYKMGRTILNVLKSKCLISIDGGGRIEIHDQLRDMGRRIVEEGKKDRVWEEETASDILKEERSLSRLVGLSISIGTCSPEEEVAMCSELPRLKILVVNDREKSGRASHHNRSRRDLLGKVRCDDLRWLKWTNASFEGLPGELCGPKLQVLDLSGSNISKVPASLPNLGTLNARQCKNLKKLPEPLGRSMPSLRCLDLAECTQLEGLDSSIGTLTDLRILNLSFCRLPSEITGFSCLEELHLHDCTSVTALSCVSTSLRKVNLNHCSNIQSLNLNASLPNLEELHLQGCKDLKRPPEALVTASTRFLRILNLAKWDSLERLDCEGLSCLQELRLSECTSLTALSCLSTSLQRLHLDACHNLESLNLNVSLPNLDTLSLFACVKLKMSPAALATGSTQSLRELNLSGCRWLERFDYQGFSCLKTVNLAHCESLTVVSCLSTNLQELNLNHCCNLESLNLNVSLPNLQQLGLKVCPKLKRLPEALLTASTPSLQVLNLDEWDSLESLDCNGFSCLRELYLYRSTSLTSLSCLSESMKTLNLGGCCNLENLNLNVSLPNLQNIWLFECTKLKSLPQALTTTSIPSLLSLSLDGWDSLQNLNWEGFPRLEELYLRGCTSLTALSCLPASLKILDLDGCCSLESLRLNDTFAASMPSLRVLRLCGWDPLESLDCKGFCCLEELSLSNCTSLTALSCLSTSLQKLYLNECGNLESLNLNVSLPNLQELSLNGCTKVKVLPEALAETSTSSLRVLSLVGCDSLMNLDCDGLSDLRTLIVVECTSLKALSCLSTSLRVLVLSDCCNVERLNVNVSLPNLEVLALIGGAKFMRLPEGVATTSAPSLRNLFLSKCETLERLDFEGLSCLEELSLSKCRSVTALSCHSTTLKRLFLNECCILESLNLNVSLPKLQQLTLRVCPKLKGLPEALLNASTPSLLMLNLDEWDSLENLDCKGLPDLQILSLDECTSLKKLSCLPTSLRGLSLRGCIQLEDVGRDAVTLSNLTYLDIRECPCLMALSSEIPRLHSLGMILNESEAQRIRDQLHAELNI